jgi:4'-phosphopantetheinyl transferase
VDAVPVEPSWLTDAERLRAAGFTHGKRRIEYLVRRLAAKHALATALGLSVVPSDLARIEVANEPGGAPHALLDGVPAGVGISLTDRAGWAVCLLGDGGGCDLELVEPRSEAFVRDFFTAAERAYVAGCPAGEPRHEAANLIWSAKESALKVLRTGLRRDTRDVAVRVAPAGPDGWGRLAIAVAGPGPSDGALPGWWRREGAFVLTVAGAATGPPAAMEDPGPLTTAAPRPTTLGPWRTGA